MPRLDDGPVKLNGHDAWSDENYPENVLFGDFLGGSWDVARQLVKASDIPKYSHEGKTTIFGPLDEIDPSQFDDMARRASDAEDEYAGEGDYQYAERARVAEQEFRNLADRVRQKPNDE